MVRDQYQTFASYVYSRILSNQMNLCTQFLPFLQDVGTIFIQFPTFVMNFSKNFFLPFPRTFELLLLEIRY
jgi:hypothetical protein